MAKPIAPTPDLKGKEAEKFLKEVSYPKMENVTKEDVLRGKKIFEIIERNTADLKNAYR
ncbi:hypothetical protein HZC34_02505 [Candidatus Saganbacteria bacterium]|nr:hypothetical protein [Candidatus Saganbacteria bacterium]